MNWDVERDNSGRAIRMWWRGSGGRPRNKSAPTAKACPECGFINGWHKMACSRHTSSDAQK